MIMSPCIKGPYFKLILFPLKERVGVSVLRDRISHLFLDVFVGKRLSVSKWIVSVERGT